jgi:hypothetical protein
MWTNGQTDMTKLIAVFCNFSKALKSDRTKLEVAYVEHGGILLRMLRLYQSCSAEEEEE